MKRLIVLLALCGTAFGQAINPGGGGGGGSATLPANLTTVATDGSGNAVQATAIPAGSLAGVVSAARYQTTLATATQGLSGCGSGSVALNGLGACATISSILGYIPAVGGLKQTAGTVGVGDSYVLGSGATSPATSVFALLARDTPGTSANFGVGGTTIPQIGASMVNSFGANASLPTVLLVNGGENDGPLDTCTGGTGTNCTTNAALAEAATIYYGAISPTHRILASNSTSTTGTWLADTTFNPISGVGLTSPGTGSKSTVSGSTKTFTIPASWNSIKVGINYYAITGQTGTWTVSLDGVLQTDICSGTTTFTSAPCGNVAIPSTNQALYRQEYAPTTLGATAHTVVITTTNAALSGFLGVDSVASAGNLPANTSIEFAMNVGSPFTNSATYNTTVTTVINQANSDGLPVYLINANTILTAANLSITATSTCPATTLANHPNDCGYAALMAAINAAESANSQLVSTYGQGGKQPALDGIFYGPIRAKTSVASRAAATHNMSTDPSVIGTRMDFFNNNAGNMAGFGFGKDAGSGQPYSSGYGASIYSVSSLPWTLFQIDNGSTSFSESNYTTHAAINNLTGAAYFSLTQSSYFIQVVGAAITSAATIAPVNGIVHVTGTAAISTITPPTGMSATVGGCITLIADGAWSTVTGGNIFAAMTAVAGTPYTACKDATTWYLK